MASKDRGDTKYSLLMRWVMINAFALVFIWVAWRTGWVTTLVATDSLYISRGILAYFGIAMLNCTWKIQQTSRELNVAQEYVRAVREKNAELCATIEGGNSRVAHFLSEVKGLSPDGRREIGEIFAEDLSGNLNGTGYRLMRLAALGSIFMLFGIGITLKVFDTPLTDASQVLPLFNKVPMGLRVALFPALIAGIAAYWLDHMFELLDEGTHKLITWIKKAGVYHAEQKAEVNNAQQQSS